MSDSGGLWVAIIMGSKSDWETMKAGSEILTDFGIPHECKVLSAHRTPVQLMEYMKDAEARACEVFIGGAGGAAHLPGVMAAQTLRPVLGVPITSALQGLDSILSIAQMPGGIPVGCMAIGKAGAINAALMAAAILAGTHPEMTDKIRGYREKRAEKVLSEDLPIGGGGIGFKR